MIIGYARVSTIGQDVETQKEILQEHGCEKIFAEKVTGTSTAPRQALTNMLDQIRSGDKIVVTKIDRLARSIIDLNKIVDDLTSQGVTIEFLSENMKFQGGNQSNSLQTLLFNVLGSFAQFERDLIVERTTEGRERAKRQGKHIGRPAQPVQQIKRALKLYRERQTNEMSVNDISKMTGVPRSTIYHELKKQRIDG